MEQSISKELIDGLLNIFSSHLVSIILYGSVARGNDTSESDVDIAIILNESPTSEELDSLIELSVFLDMKYNKVFSIIDIDYQEFLKWEDIVPFYKNVKKDGVILWKAA